jgi:hypothetical protein
MENFYAAWCYEDGTILAKPGLDWDSTYELYCTTFHTEHTLANCRWRGVFTGAKLAEFIIMEGQVNDPE